MELDQIARAGARRMLIAALETEAVDYVERHREERNQAGAHWWCTTAEPRGASFPGSGNGGA